MKKYRKSTDKKAKAKGVNISFSEFKKKWASGEINKDWINGSEADEEDEFIDESGVASGKEKKSKGLSG